MLAWACAILVMTSWPGSPPRPAVIPHLDKAAHFTVYCLLGILTWRALLTPRRVAHLAGAFGGIALFGALDELHQLLVPYREASVADWSADLLGALIGLRIAASLLARLPRPHTRQDLPT